MKAHYAKPKNRKWLSDKAKRQHAAGNFGRQTWKTKETRNGHQV